MMKSINFSGTVSDSSKISMFPHIPIYLFITITLIQWGEKVAGFKRKSCNQNNYINKNKGMKAGDI